MRNKTNNTTLKITINENTRNLLANIMLAIHQINKQPLKTNEGELAELLESLLKTKQITSFLETTFEHYDEFIRKNP